ncbi:hypothetical protein PUNSTDRAFT_101371 [Punctularia strigosozonata HHB-11173 SS5]|uniref:uncharacterized protein n=1 Tax=Punctularia strigosozonata (strain HHB-11173) TaxID=741275 RepID=UPI0004417C83|nr:uncharacterized protein PUNSTDRAFT_101371 [Punctularia strigosozonata HHB-11173 SS5]EIN09522.1 hypothetical protein PUNSTDRAFT_101371 [Punctularia strigosozonata HHB-11173 SS5]
MFLRRHVLANLTAVLRPKPFSVTLRPLDPLLSRFAHSDHGIPTPPALKVLRTLEDNNKARMWLDRFKASPVLPRELVELTFSRSSGPGGQNVNKVNTKATLRCPVDAGWIPPWARGYIVRSPHYAASSRSILITSTVHRSQAQNIDECLSKACISLSLRTLIVQAASASIVNEASPEQKERVRKLEVADQTRRRIAKAKQSCKKQSRSKRDWSD